MKKLFALLMIAAVVSFSSFNEEKSYTVKLTAPQVNALWYCLDNSRADHTVVKDIQKILGDQLAPQMDTTKKK